MSRTIPVNVETDLDSRHVIPIFFVQLLFDTDPLYLHTDLGDITDTSVSPEIVYTGTGGLGQISPIEETLEERAPGIKLRMQITDETSGSIFQELTQQDFYQRDVVILFSTRNTTTGAVLDDPFEIFRGRADVPEMVHGHGESFVDLVVENEWADGARATNELYSDAQLQSDFPGDLGFEFLADLVNKTVPWVFNAGGVFKPKPGPPSKGLPPPGGGGPVRVGPPSKKGR